MFNSITWAQYITTVAFLLICYYVYVGFRYYRWELLSLIGIKKVDNSSVAISTVANFKESLKPENNEDYLPKPALEIDISPLVKSFTDEVQAYVLAAGKDAVKEELLYALQLIIAKYPALKSSDCRDEMIQFVLTETNAKYPNVLQSIDVNRLWQ